MLRLFQKKKAVVTLTPSYIVFNVMNFNNWFNAKDNGAEYAHPGIFLRLDKLSNSHIVDYLKKCHGYTDDQLDSLSLEILDFHDEIRKDWRFRLHHSKDRLNELIKTLKMSVQPVDGHSDPGSIEDCWNELQDVINRYNA